MPGQMWRRRDRFAIGSRKSDCTKSEFRRRMSRTFSGSQEYLYAPHHGRARIAASSPCNDSSKRRKRTCARMRTPCLIDSTYCYISTPAPDGADRREERVVHCDQPCTARAAELSNSASTTLRNGVNGEARPSAENGPARSVQAEQWQGAAIK